MKSQTVVVCVALLALCCLLIPRGGESAGGILSLQQAESSRQLEDELPEPDRSLEDPESERGLAGDPRPLEINIIRARRDTEAAVSAGHVGRVRREPEEGKKKKKDKKKNKNKEPKDPSATKKPKTDKKGKKKDKKKTTTLPPTTTVIPTEPPTEPEAYTDYPYLDPDQDYWKPDDDYWEAEPTASRPQPESPITDSPYDYWQPEEPEPAAPVTDPYDDDWKPDGKEPSTPTPDIYDDYWKPDGKEPSTPIPDIYDDYWKPDGKEPSNTDIYDDYWKPDGKEPSTPIPDIYDDYWKPDETGPDTTVVDNYDNWKEEDPTDPAPEVDVKVGTDDTDYWDAKYEHPFPDGKEVGPDITIETLPEEPTATPPFEGAWYDDYDEYGMRKKDDETDEKWVERERERGKKEREREERERARKLKEAEERARTRPRVYKEPKKCPPLGMESHRIEPDQLSASSMAQYHFAPQRARLNMQGSDDEEDMRGGAWCANSEDKIHWFEIDARRETEFTGVITQGRESFNESDYVTSYFLAFSNDSREWTTIHDGYADWLFFGNNDKDTPVMNQLAESVLARYIRIIPQSWNGSLCMRLEVLGCPLPDPNDAKYRLNEVTPVDYLQFKHHSYSEMITLMKSVNEECPNITNIYSLGRSSKGQEIMAIVISGNPTEHEIGEPEFRFTAGLHGNEAIGREMLLLLMQYLCKEYKDRNPRVQRLVEGIRIHLVPSLNPDGQTEAFEAGSELSSWTTGHFTDDGFDIFQNFPDLNSVLWDAEDKGMVPKLTPNHHVPIPEHYESNSSIAVETRAVISWMKSHPFVLGANFQGGETIVAYPYDSLRPNKPARSQEARSRKKRQYEDEGFDATEWGQGYHEEPEEDWRGRGYSEPEEEWRGHGHDPGYEHGYDRGYEHGYDRSYDRGHEGYDRGHESYGHDRTGYDHGHNAGYDQGHNAGYDHGHNAGYDHGHNAGYGHREEEEDDRGRSAGYQYAEPEDEPRVIADESLFRWLAVSYASTHLTMTHSYHGSCHGDTAAGTHGIVNRAKWKPVTGSMNDFSYLHTNCLELSIFLGCDKFPHQSELAYEWEKNREAMLIFMEQVHRGIRGIVKDQQGNAIANATVSVEGVNHDVTTAPTGDYWRLLNPGEYRVTARAEGFSSVTKLCVVGYQSGATTCSFNLAKSNWDRIKQIMALHGNKPIRLSYSNNRVHYPATGNGNRRVVVNNNNALSPNSRVGAERRRRLRIARLRRLRQQKLMKQRLTTTALPPTTTTTTAAPTTVPTTAEATTSWYDSWLIDEGQSSTPGGFTDSILDYNYEFKIDDY
ncbi:inactive carboxypeptidase X2 [Solea senegalensis]|uniref:Inactive carboxypeptidase X2 n=1 Tax=Solea senegalensis TaxID=28829 RepID=A0AAV6QHQ0_SOLSE|nr:inactive carboxypeptidase-like protein X2 [Solea senegalensis]KAG7490517.1 inactive carboxypeptidase X2 [Solea senegalensis]